VKFFVLRCIPAFFIVLMVGEWSPVSGQMLVPNPDSVKNVIAHTADPDKKLSALLALCSFRHTLPADTTEYYLNMARSLSLEHGSSTDKYWIDFYTAGFLVNKGFLDSAMKILNVFIPQLDNSNAERNLFQRAQFLKTNTFVRKNEFREALKGYYTILREAHSQNDTINVAMARNGLGWVLMEMGQYQNALSWLLSALHTSTDTSLYQKYSFVYSNIASSYNSLSITDSAEYYALKAIEGAKKFNDQECLANSLNILADTYILTKRSTAAENLLQQVVLIRKKIGDPYYIVSDMMQLAIFYAHHNEPDKGINISLEGIDMARKMDLNSKLPILYDALAQNYLAMGDYKNYAGTLKDLIAIKDSVYKINSVDVMKEMQARNQLQKNENTIIRQKLSLVEKNYWLNAYLLFSIIGVIVTGFIFREYRKKNKTRMQMIVENEKQMALKAIIEAEDNQRKRISGDLHDSLGVQANAILYGTELLQQDPGSKMTLINDLHDTAKDMLVTLRETLWAMKVTDATAAAVWLRVINFSKQLGRYYPSVSISTQGAVPAGFHISSPKSLNTVLILQEALNNSVRHSGARNIFLSSMDDEDAWTIMLEDDGRGFDPEAAQEKRESYGLINMKSRAESSGIHLTIETAEHKGVKVLLSIDHPE
jgi:two-component system NarL family sensor kinase